MAEYTENTMVSETTSEKIKAINPQIIVGGTIDKPCYSISYYDVKRKEWVIGFSSFNREYVQGWLAECFEEIEAELAEVKHGKWIMRGGWFRCSKCDEKAELRDVGGTGGFSHEYEQIKSNYCPNCGAKMDKE